jgi:hypothetical protein
MAPKVKLKEDPKLLFTKQKIADNNNNLWLPTDIKLTKKQTNSWFDKNYYKANIINYNTISTGASVPKIKGTLYKSKTVKLVVNNARQKEILINWLNAFRIMYNYTIKYIFDNLSKKDIILLKQYNDQILKSTKLIKTKEKENIKLKQNLIKLNKSLKKMYVKKKIKSMETKRKEKLKSTIIEIHEIKNSIKNNNKLIKSNSNSLYIAKKIKNTVQNKINQILNYKRVRTYVLKDMRDDIIKKSNKDNTEDLSVYTHILDASIKKACANYKTCVTNYVDGNCKLFKIKYWRQNKKSLIMEIEKCYIRNNQIAPSKLGQMKYYYDGEEFKLPNTTINVYYNKELNEFTVGIATSNIKYDIY